MGFNSAFKGLMLSRFFRLLFLKRISWCMVRRTNCCYWWLSCLYMNIFIYYSVICFSFTTKMSGGNQIVFVNGCNKYEIINRTYNPSRVSMFYYFLYLPQHPSNMDDLVFFPRNVPTHMLYIYIRYDGTLWGTFCKWNNWFPRPLLVVTNMK